jgi:hypothetical protein
MDDGQFFLRSYDFTEHIIKLWDEELVRVKQRRCINSDPSISNGSTTDE